MTFPRPKLYVLAGIPGCGKSTWAKQWDVPVVSSDAIRDELNPGGDYDPTLNAQVFEIFHDRLHKHLSLSGHAIADATSLAPEARKKLRDIAAEHEAECHLFFWNNVDQALNQNNQRTGKACVPHAAMLTMLDKFKAAKDDIYGYGESYDSITVIEGTYRG